jgi:membrane protease YdiL (CAAX protease family)
MVQILVFPMFVMALQLVINPDLVHAIATSFRHASALVFVLGANVLANSATSILIIEGSALWILCTAPQALEKLLLQKVALWASLALIYACIALTVALVFVPFGAAAVGDAIMVLVGLPIYAVIGAGLGAAATDPLEVTPQRRMRPDTVFLFLILIGMYTQALYTADWHGRIAYVVLSLVLAYALWQRLADRLPFLLDPAARPPRDLALSDGALAAMTFLVGQGILQMLLLQAGVDAEIAMVWAFAGSGMLAAGVTLAILLREKVQGLWRVSGLWPTPDARGPMMSFLIGAVAGAAAAGVATLWLAVAHRYDWFHTDDEGGLSMPFTTILILTVVLAPLCEEFIFRGLVYGGLRRTLPIRWAIPAAAAIFAIVHPSISVVPVFVLGVATASAYQATGWLLAPIIAHALYNFIVVSLQV